MNNYCFFKYLIFFGAEFDLRTTIILVWDIRMCKNSPNEPKYRVHLFNSVFIDEKEEADKGAGALLLSPD
jgi:hypothetical protein